jgi:hypothetical protein
VFSTLHPRVQAGLCLGCRARLPLAVVSAGEAAPGATRRLSRAATTWRLIAAFAGIAALAHGTIADSDDYFPFGSMAQYATAHDLDAKVNSTYMLADTESGRQKVRVPLNATGTGIGRAEVEGQLDRIVADPSRLQTIADAYEAIHPDRDHYATLYLMRDTYQLRDGYQAGPPVTVELARWTVE